MPIVSVLDNMEKRTDESIKRAADNVISLKVCARCRGSVTTGLNAKARL